MRIRKKLASLHPIRMGRICRAASSILRKSVASFLALATFATMANIGALALLFNATPAVAAASETLVISELEVNGSGTAGNEFVEIYNKTGSAINLAGSDIAYAAPASETLVWTEV